MDNRQLAHEIIRLLRLRGEMTPAEISEACGTGSPQLPNVLGFMLKFGLITFELSSEKIELSQPMKDLQNEKLSDKWLDDIQ